MQTEIIWRIAYYTVHDELGSTAWVYMLGIPRFWHQASFSLRLLTPTAAAAVVRSAQSGFYTHPP